MTTVKPFPKVISSYKVPVTPTPSTHTYTGTQTHTHTHRHIHRVFCFKEEGPLKEKTEEKKSIWPCCSLS